MTTSVDRQFLADMTALGNDLPGVVTPKTHVYKLLGIVIPECMTPEDCKTLAMTLLGPIGHMRDELLHHGLYFGAKGNTYRVLDLNDTSKAILAYAIKAKNAAQRGKTLNHNLHKTYNKFKVSNHDAFVKAIAALSAIKP